LGNLHPDWVRFLAHMQALHPYQAHEALEAAWRRRGDPLQGDEVARALIQVAAAYVHGARGRQGPARTLLLRAARRLWAARCTPPAEKVWQAAGVRPHALAWTLLWLANEPLDRWPPAGPWEGAGRIPRP
jgi:hypothetical protein